MSSMRNAVQRRNHKERAQPLGREKWGLLEKRKDYTLRARDHKEKQKRLKILKEKAAFANPDEFSFKMMSSRTKNGQRIADRGTKVLDMDVVKLLKTQDAGYVRTVLQKTKRERERLETELQIAGTGRLIPLTGDGVEEEEDDDNGTTRRITFVDSREEQEAILGVHEHEIIGEDAKETKRLSRRDAEAQRNAEIEAGRAQNKRAHQQKARRQFLRAIRKREEELTIAEQELGLQRAKMSNSVGGVNKNGVEFKIRERKR